MRLIERQSRLEHGCTKFAPEVISDHFNEPSSTVGTWILHIEKENFKKYMETQKLPSEFSFQIFLSSRVIVLMHFLLCNKDWWFWVSQFLAPIYHYNQLNIQNHSSLENLIKLSSVSFAFG